VIAPSTAADAKGLHNAAIRDPNPVMFLENEILYGHSSPVPKLDDYVLPIGRARIVRAGKDVTIVAWSMGMNYTLKAAEELAKDGIEAEVIDLRTLKPMDSDTIIESVKKTGRIVTVEEGWRQSGVGAEIAARVMEQAFDYLDAPVMRVTGKLSCAIRGYDVLKSQLGAHVLIYGSGTMGLMMLELAKRTGAASVDVVDINPSRLETARSLGCSSAVTSADELDRPRGWELVIDATGAAAAIQDGLSRVAPAGTFLQFGVAAYATRVTIEPYRIYNKEITITGSMAVLHSYERAADMFAAGLLDPDVFISDRLPLASYADALAKFKRGEGRKIQVLP
jgi:hypothetical protein